MATKLAKRSSPTFTRRAAPMVSKARFESLKARSTAVARRLRDASGEDTDAAVAVASGLGLALFERSGRSLPTVMGYDPALVWGVAGWALTRGKKGKGASLARSAGLALATIGVNRSALRGSLRVGEDDSSYTEDEDL